MVGLGSGDELGGGTGSFLPPVSRSVAVSPFTGVGGVEE